MALLVLVNDRATCLELLKLYDDCVIGGVSRELLVRNFNTVERIIKYHIFDNSVVEFRHKYKCHPFDVKFLRSQRKCNYGFQLSAKKEEIQFCTLRAYSPRAPFQFMLHICTLQRNKEGIFFPFRIAGKSQ